MSDDNILLLICGKQKVVLMSQHENRIHPCSTYRALNDWTLNGPGKTGASITPLADYYPSILAMYVFKNDFLLPLIGTVVEHIIWGLCKGQLFSV